MKMAFVNLGSRTGDTLEITSMKAIKMTRGVRLIGEAEQQSRALRGQTIEAEIDQPITVTIYPKGVPGGRYVGHPQMVITEAVEVSPQAAKER